jgi:hypothetical protein
MFAFFKAKRHGMLRLFGWSILNKRLLMSDPNATFVKHRARQCRAIARRWDGLARQAETAEQRRLRELIADGWRDLARGR